LSFLTLIAAGCHPEKNPSQAECHVVQAGSIRNGGNESQKLKLFSFSSSRDIRGFLWNICLTGNRNGEHAK
ncbi:hypothetical protein RA265_30605, partial [Pseudomonas syringae pv. tagetis]|uniref:hypothetical protein n=1 Tax=Pseudomonas syringae group genomosp. 7 TaxID=251699 RepID=UPI00377067DE